MDDGLREIVSQDGKPFIVASPDHLVGGTRLNFDLYLVDDFDQPTPVLYREKNLNFDASAKQRLLESTSQFICIPADSAPAFYRYVEVNLDKILWDPDVDTGKKTAAIYDCAQYAIREILADPGSPDVVPRSEKLVRSATEFVFRSPEAFHYFLRTASFDYEVYTHSVNVFMYCIHLMRASGHDDLEFIFRFGTGAFLHDIGKSRVDPEILHARGKLTEEQWEQMVQHPVWGWEMLRDHGVTDPIILTATRSHHEKLDGSGYPDGLLAADIPDYVRICTVCDVFDALTTQRSYKDAIQSFDALRLMRDEMAGQLDRGMFENFVKVLLDEPS